jgi:quercetin dioxygenase-like cupin family protein
MIIKKPAQVPAKPVHMEGVKDAKVQVVFGPDDQAPTFAMRIFELAGGGHTPYHEHAFEHEVMILQGDIAIVTPEKEIPVEQGDMILLLPDETHQFKNLSDSAPARFMCLVPIAYQS